MCVTDVLLLVKGEGGLGYAVGEGLDEMGGMW
jgi:hypothetical protein